MIKLFGKSRIINYDEEINLKRDKGVEYVAGKPVALGHVWLKFKANVQPLMGRELLIVPEGDRFKEQYYVWSEFQILINDEIHRLGIKFQVQQIENWGSYTRARMVRIDVGTNASD